MEGVRTGKLKLFTINLLINLTKFKNFALQNEKALVWSLVIITFILRLSFTSFMYSNYGTDRWVDDWEYLICGQQIADGNWFPSVNEEIPYMQAGPVLPMIIAFSINLFGSYIWPIFLYNIIVTSLLIAVLFYLGKLIFSRKAGWIFALWGIFYIDFFKYCPFLLKESTNFFFLPLTVYLLIISLKNKGQILPLVLSVLSYSWLIHADERYIIYAPLFGLSFLLINPFSIKNSIKKIFLWSSLLLVVMVPWTIHNYRNFGQLVLISPRTTAFTSKLWGENIRQINFGELKQTEERILTANQFGEEYGIKPHEYSKYGKYLHAFINFWQPTYFTPTYIRDGYRGQKWSLSHNICGLYGYGGFIPFFIIGIVLLIRRRHYLGLLLAIIPLIHGFVHTIMIWPLERYRSPIVFCVVAIAIWCFLELVLVVKKNKMFVKVFK